MSNLCEKCKYSEIYNDSSNINMENVIININGKINTICTNNDPSKVMNFNEDYQISCSLFEEKEN